MRRTIGWMRLTTGVAAIVLLALGGAMLGADSAAGSVFLSQAELKAIIGKPGVKVVDTRPAAAYAARHIAGAVNLPFNVLQVPERDGLRSELAEDSEIEKAFSQAGLSYDDEVILYDETSISAGRQYTVFLYAGFPKLKVLDGGIAAWVSVGGGVDNKPIRATATEFRLTRKNAGFLVGGDYVAQRIGDNRARIVDGRSVQAYDDGHIPTAEQVSPGELLRPDRTLKGAEELLALLASRGVTPDKEVISYCGSGPAAAQNFLVLKQLGFTKLVLYDNSWDEWSRETKYVQELSLPNYVFSGTAVNAPGSLGPRFLTEQELKSAMERRSVLVVDVRSGSDFGAGHIPDSVNAFWNETLDGNRNLKSLEDLAEFYTERGITPDRNIVLFARGGVQLTHSYVVLKLLGYPDVSVFTGRWDGWEMRAWKDLAAREN